MSITFRIIFVRHGETVGNKLKRVQGSVDEPLSEFGIKQGIEAGKALKNVKFNTAYASTLSRAYNTCQKIQEENMHSSFEIKKDKRIMERNFGIFEGKTFEFCDKMIKENAPKNSWLNYTPEGAEKPGDVKERIVQFFKELCQSVYDKNIHSNSKTELENKKDSSKENINEETQPPLSSEETTSECILIVSHGFALLQLYNHFAHTLSCANLLKEDVSGLSPNTGISEFIIRYSPRKYSLHCVRIHDGSHLKNITD